MKRRNISSNVGFLLVHSIIRTCMDRTYVSSTKIFVTHLCVRLNTLTYYFTISYLIQMIRNGEEDSIRVRVSIQILDLFHLFIYLFTQIFAKISMNDGRIVVN